jgi:hypothetical protein
MYHICQSVQANERTGHPVWEGNMTLNGILFVDLCHTLLNASRSHIKFSSQDDWELP